MRGDLISGCGRAAGWAVLLVAATALAGSAADGDATAQTRGGVMAGVVDAPQNAAEEGEDGFEQDTMQRLFAAASDGSGDPHLPFVLSRLKKALADQDMLGFLDLVEPAYFEEQFRLLSRPGRSPGETLRQFSCEFFSLCDISKTYSFNDIVSMDVRGVSDSFGGGQRLIEVRLELRMWDGLLLVAPVYYDPGTARLSAAVG